MRDDPRKLDRTTLLLTFLYKFARHEWVGISAAWDVTPTLADSVHLTDRISRYHLAEEFGHMRLFHEMFETFRLDRVEWVPLPRWVRRAYELFTAMPPTLMASAAFVTELMGFTVYLHLDQILDSILAGEPEARDRVRTLLYDIAGDELGHVGLRRNYLGPLGCRAAKLMVGPMFRGFLRSMPEAALLFDVGRMVKDAQGFDYAQSSGDPLRRVDAFLPRSARERHARRRARRSVPGRLLRRPGRDDAVVRAHRPGRCDGPRRQLRLHDVCGGVPADHRAARADAGRLRAEKLDGRVRIVPSPSIRPRPSRGAAPLRRRHGSISPPGTS